MRFVWFSYYKTVNRTAQCGAVHYYLWCGAVMLFCGFWYGFDGLVNTHILHYTNGLPRFFIASENMLYLYINQ